MRPSSNHKGVLLNLGGISEGVEDEVLSILLHKTAFAQSNNVRKPKRVRDDGGVGKDAQCIEETNNKWYVRD